MKRFTSCTNDAECGIQLCRVVRFRVNNKRKNRFQVVRYVTPGSSLSSQQYTKKKSKLLGIFYRVVRCRVNDNRKHGLKLFAFFFLVYQVWRRL